MTSKVAFPIRTKLLLLMSGLVLAATASYLLLATHLFREDKTALIYELNASNVKTLAAQAEAYVVKAADKIRLLTQGYHEQSLARAVLESDPDLVSYALYRPTKDPARWDSVLTVRNNDYLKIYGLTESEVTRVRDKAPLNFPKILAKKFLVFNSTIPESAPLLTVAMALDLKDKAGGSELMVAVADLRLDRMLKLVQGHGFSNLFIVDSEGRIVAHRDVSQVQAHAEMKDDPVVAEALSSPVTFQMKRYTVKDGHDLGAFAVAGNTGLRVISEVDEDQAFKAARELIQKSILFGLIVVTAALLLSEMMARSFTQPLHKLLGSTEKLSRGQFGESVHVKTRDEIGSLARAFNAMATDLQTQRTLLENHQKELELKVKERTEALELQKRQLADSQDSLIRTTRMASLGEMAGSAAHEVLNPINNMNIRVQKIQTQLVERDIQDAKLSEEILTAWKKTFSEGGWDALEKELKKPAANPPQTLLEEDLENLVSITTDLNKRLGERREDMDFLAKEIIRVTRIINNMRSLSRVGGERRPLDIHVPIDETSVTLADIFVKRNVEFIKDFGGEARDQYMVIGDKDEMIQVFSNLIRNGLHAIDLAKRRAGAIRVSTRRGDKRVEVRIADNGSGISRENLARIFEPNFTTKSVEEGTGLGLSISRRLVRAFGGDIEIEKSVEGEGTTFLIWFPAAS